MSQWIGYLLTRVGHAAIVVWAAFTVAFLILYLLPGDPVTVMLGTDTYVDPAQLEALREHYRLDQPVHVQYLAQLMNLLRGDLGTSISSGAPVTASILGVLPDTIALTATALALSVALAAGIALLASYTRVQWLRRAVLSLPPLGVSLPTFWVGLLLIQVFSFQLGLFPAVGNNGPQSLVLPAVTLAIPTSASLAKVFAQGLDQALSQPYAEAARAKGLTRLQVLFEHAAKNALLPTVTILALTVGGLLAGAVVTETVFSRVGVGRLAETAVAAQDTPMVMGLVVLAAAIFAVLNLITDLIYPVLDPRITSPNRLQGRAA